MKELKERNQAITDQYKTGQYSYEEIGMLYGISRERVRKIIYYYLSKPDRDKIKMLIKVKKWRAKKPI